MPGLVTVACVHDEHGGYLAVARHPETGARPDDIPGDLVVRGRRLDDWGLHLVDMNLAMGNLMDIVGGWR